MYEQPFAPGLPVGALVHPHAHRPLGALDAQSQPAVDGGLWQLQGQRRRRLDIEAGQHQRSAALQLQLCNLGQGLVGIPAVRRQEQHAVRCPALTGEHPLQRGVCAQRDAGLRIALQSQRFDARSPIVPGRWRPLSRRRVGFCQPGRWGRGRRSCAANEHDERHRSGEGLPTQDGRFGESHVFALKRLRLCGRLGQPTSDWVLCCGLPRSVSDSVRGHGAFRVGCGPRTIRSGHQSSSKAHGHVLAL